MSPANIDPSHGVILPKYIGNILDKKLSSFSFTISKIANLPFGFNTRLTSFKADFKSIKFLTPNPIVAYEKKSLGNGRL